MSKRPREEDTSDTGEPSAKKAKPNVDSAVVDASIAAVTAVFADLGAAVIKSVVNRFCADHTTADAISAAAINAILSGDVDENVAEADAEAAATTTTTTTTTTGSGDTEMTEAEESNTTTTTTTTTTVDTTSTADTTTATEASNNAGSSEDDGLGGWSVAQLVAEVRRLRGVLKGAGLGAAAQPPAQPAAAATLANGSQATTSTNVPAGGAAAQAPVPSLGGGATATTTSSTNPVPSLASSDGGAAAAAADKPPNKIVRGESASLELARKLAEEDAKAAAAAKASSGPAEEMDAETLKLVEALRARDCGICLMESEGDECHPLKDCGCYYCRDCLIQYLNIAIKSRDLPLKCPTASCKKEIGVLDLEMLLTEEVMNDYMKLSLSMTLSNNPDEFSCCMTPDCPVVFFFDEADGYDFECEGCGKRYCLKCKVEYHTGSTCKEYQQWKKDNGMADEKFDNFVRGQRFKQCPKCNRWVEKASGCNHITCMCKHKFCYNCGESYPCTCGKDPHVRPPPVVARKKAAPRKRATPKKKKTPAKKKASKKKASKKKTK